MFEEFKKAWRQAVDNFWAELDAEAPADSDARTRAVYREVGRARTQLERLDAEIDDVHARLAHEREQVAVCKRRERMARKIRDEDTAKVAAEYGARHAERAGVLERKRQVLEAERELCRRDLGEMERALQDGRVVSEREKLKDLDRHPQEPEFRDIEESARARSADERLEEIKRRMGR